MIKRFALLSTLMLILVAGVSLVLSGGVVESQCSHLATTGTVAWVRVNNVETGFGPSNDFIDGEVIFQLNNGDRYGYRLRDNRNALVAEAGVSLLLEAMRNGWRVEVDYSDCGGRNHEVRFGRVRVIR